MKEGWSRQKESEMREMLFSDLVKWKGMRGNKGSWFIYKHREKTFIPLSYNNSLQL